MPLILLFFLVWVVWNCTTDVIARAKGETPPREKHRAARAAAREARTGNPGRVTSATGRPLLDYLADLWADSWEEANTLRADRAADRRAVYEKARADGASVPEAARIAGYGILAKLRGLLAKVEADRPDDEDDQGEPATPEPDRGEARTACPNCGYTLARDPRDGWLHPDGTNICPATGSAYPIPEPRRPAPEPDRAAAPAPDGPATQEPASEELPEIPDWLILEARAVRDEAGYVDTALLQRTLQLPYDMAAALVAQLKREHLVPEPAPDTEGTTPMADETNYEGTLAAHTLLLEENKRIADALAIIDDAVRNMATAAELVAAAAARFTLPQECLAGANAVTDGFNADEVHRLMELTDNAEAGITSSQDYLIGKFGDAADVMASTGADGSFVNSNA